MKKVLLTSISCLLAVASAVAQDYTSYIVNPSFEEGTEGWEITNLVPQTNTSFKTNDGQSLKAGNTYLEKWVGKGGAAGSASAVQSVSGLPLGKYTLTVSAQNLDQNDVNKACTGVTIYAKVVTTKATVTVPGDYSVNFDVTSSTTATKIGFSAASASGNWLAVDNFRIVKVGDIATSTMVSHLKVRVTTANITVKKTMAKDVKEALESAITVAGTMTADNTPDEINAAIKNLNDAVNAANASSSDLTNLSKLIKTSEGYVGQTMQKEIAERLDAAIAKATPLSSDNTSAEINASISELTAVNSDAFNNIQAYISLANGINNMEAAYNPSFKGAEEFNAFLTLLKEKYDNRSITTPEAKDYTARIPDIIFGFRINNPTKGEGSPVSVTLTNHYVPTGATEALMRAEFTGDNILEKGICWSTEHNPTVIDERTKTFWALNGNMYHATGLKPATVYYFRPYVINSTYEVAYGDEVKVVTHPQGNCTWSWDEAGPDVATNDRCRNAIRETIEYFNEWTGIMGFHLSGHYVPGAGAGTGTADCSYGGYMRISQNAANQAIGTVLHETGHGVGVGTSSRYADKNLHDWKWFGREANKVYSFLENKEANPYTSDFCMVGDGTHAWGASATYDWFINGSSKDTHQALQYAGGSILLYGMFVDGLNPTYGHSNGIPAYTYNYDDRKTYYIMCKSDQRGLGTGVVGASTITSGGVDVISLKWKNILGDAAFLTDNDAWELTYNAYSGYYQFRNIGTGRYLSHATGLNLKALTAPTEGEDIQLMPDRTDVTIGEGDKQFTTHGYWFTWNNNGLKAMQAQALSGTTGSMGAGTFNFADTATPQQFIIIAEDELVNYRLANGFLLGDVNLDGKVDLADAKLITDYYLGKNPASFAKELADVNCDGKVTEADANIIVNQAIK